MSLFCWIVCCRLLAIVDLVKDVGLLSVLLCCFVLFDTALLVLLIVWASYAWWFELIVVCGLPRCFDVAMLIVL